ncbi:MerR family transcriptional regulator [Roseibium sp. RKSG952]|uniref:MerR family transcriptional regulator n=1 Tax=Roseibium sp. RKSG952 TaxID=2529384 RepID=UPI0012BC98BD|nr:MerR family transcriptional regulator [Roseibium sp. RKSG952]MTH94670.1 MerR family transcriptional regulator [Roseibium sp. RKSG952]
MSSDVNNEEMTIVELSEKHNVTLRTLRFYEQKKLVSPRRFGNNQRIYSRENVEKIDFIIQCRNIGLGISSIKKIIESASEGFYCPVTLADEIEKQLDNLNDEAESIKAKTEAAETWLNKIRDDADSDMRASRSFS